MIISSALRIKPFSHLPGMQLLLPFSRFIVQVFPTLLKFSIIQNGFVEKYSEISLKVDGPVNDFTVEQDLEKGWVRVFGNAKNGYFRYRISAFEDDFSIFIERGDKNILPANLQKDLQNFNLQNIEKLSLGCNKKQDWDLIVRRNDMTEILPIWFRLSQMVLEDDFFVDKGVFPLLKNLEKSNKNYLSNELSNVFMAGFYGMLVPQLYDNLYRGITESSFDKNFCPLQLFSKTRTFIRELFIKQEEKTIYLLPMCPKELHCGRFINVSCGDFGKIDFEWTKKTIRRMIFKAAKSTSIKFQFQNKIKQYRLRNNKKDKGGICENKASFNVVASNKYYLDNFQK